MELLIKPLSPLLGKEIPYPTYATSGSAALDLRACTEAPVVIPAGGRALVPTGLAIALPSAEYVALVFARSGLAVKQGLCLANGVGVIDSDYRGEVCVGLLNTGTEDYTVLPGDRIAQLMVTPVARPALTVTDELPDTARGAGGFGSTGR
ncbi:MAG: dUTP diphosphatase [Oscillospiraceae bacterium]